MQAKIQPASASAFDRFHRILRDMVAQGASDMHISAGCGFRIRIKGELMPVPDGGEILPADITAIAAKILLESRKCNRDNVLQTLEEMTDCDCSYSVSGLGRYRVNIASQRRSLALVLRHIPFELPTIQSLGLPKVIADIAMGERGLVLLTGITGSGKSSTLAAMIDHVNQIRRSKIVTIEDPIEFLYRDGLCSIIQRECGSDTASFAKALRAALRQDPDIIMVGEMRDKETIEIALKAAETGHLVMSTLHTTDAPKTILRILSVFDSSEQNSVRMRLAESLVAVISQRLLRRADGKGRVVACEIMRQTKTIQECIADPQKTDIMKEYMEKGRDLYGMQTFDQHLTELYRADIIDLQTALAAATSPADFERNLQYQ